MYAVCIYGSMCRGASPCGTYWPFSLVCVCVEMLMLFGNVHLTSVFSNSSQANRPPITALFNELLFRMTHWRQLLTRFGEASHSCLDKNVHWPATGNKLSWKKKGLHRKVTKVNNNISQYDGLIMAWNNVVCSESLFDSNNTCTPKIM